VLDNEEDVDGLKAIAGAFASGMEEQEEEEER
jgi:hypothetical protein